MFEGTWMKKALSAKSDWWFNLIILGWMLGLAIMTTSVVWYWNEEFYYGAWALWGILFAATPRQINGDKERAGMTIFGYLVKRVFEGGIIMAPPVVSKVLRLERKIFHKELPEEPEKVWQMTDKDGREVSIPQDKIGEFKLPIRATFEDADPKVDPLEAGGYQYNKPAGKSKNDPYNRRATVRVSPVMRYGIVDVLQFLQTFGVERTKEVERQLEDIVTSEVLSALQVGTYARALSNLEGLGRLITDKVIDRVCDTIDHDRSLRLGGSTPAKLVEKFWGIRIYPVQIKGLGQSHELAREVQGIAVAVAKSQSRMQQAIGDADYIQKTLKAEAAGTLVLKDKLGIEGATTVLAMRALEEGLKNGNTLVLGAGGGMSDILSVIKATSHINNEQKPKGGDK